MNKPTPWPCDIGATTRGKGLRTTPAEAERWADEQHVYRGTHRVTMAEPARLTESGIDNANMSRALEPMTEPYVLDAMQPQAEYRQAQTSSTEGCADTGDDQESDCWPEASSEMLGRLLLLTVFSVAAGGAAAWWWMST